MCDKFKRTYKILPGSSHRSANFWYRNNDGFLTELSRLRDSEEPQPIIKNNIYSKPVIDACSKIVQGHFLIFATHEKGFFFYNGRLISPSCGVKTVYNKNITGSLCAYQKFAARGEFWLVTDSGTSITIIPAPIMNSCGMPDFRNYELYKDFHKIPLGLSPDERTTKIYVLSDKAYVLTNKHRCHIWNKSHGGKQSYKLECIDGVYDIVARQEANRSDHTNVCLLFQINGIFLDYQGTGIINPKEKLQLRFNKSHGIVTSSVMLHSDIKSCRANFTMNKQVYSVVWEKNQSITIEPLNMSFGNQISAVCEIPSGAGYVLSNGTLFTIKTRRSGGSWKKIGSKYGKIKLANRDELPGYNSDLEQRVDFIHNQTVAEDDKTIFTNRRKILLDNRRKNITTSLPFEF